MFDSIKYFNEGCPVDTDLTEKVANHFDYVWKNDSDFAMHSEIAE